MRTYLKRQRLTSCQIAVTTTVQADIDIFCGGQNFGGGCCGCEYAVACGMQYEDFNNIVKVATVADFSGCLALCDSSAACVTANYQVSTNVCTLFSTAIGGVVANSDYDEIVLNDNAPCENPSCCEQR